MGRGPKRTLAAYAALVLTMTVGGIPVLAAGDPLSVINNLSTFIFSLIRAIGLILLGFGVVQVGLSLKSHDPSQRANGFLTLAGGVIIRQGERRHKCQRKHKQQRKQLFHQKNPHFRRNSPSFFHYSMGQCDVQGIFAVIPLTNRHTT